LKWQKIGYNLLKKNIKGRVVEIVLLDSETLGDDISLKPIEKLET